jgi:uncharacterized membrane protein YgdD (TMEM256/DUF423 family)
LRAWLPLQALTLYETGVRYFQVHILALLATGILLERFPERASWLTWAARGFVAGCVLFSGSLVVIALTGWNALGAVAPIGGLAWTGAWGCIALAFFRRSG